MSVEQATDKNINKKVHQNLGKTIVLFHTKWCPFCTSFRPIFAEAAKKVNEAKFVEVDISDRKDKLWKQYNIPDIPTIILFKKGIEKHRKVGIRKKGLSKEDLDRLITFSG
jgi:thiol-disulfide isomerase/thioredoxin